MEIVDYILGGLGSYLGFSSLFLSLLLLIIFMLLAIRFGLRGFSLFVIFFLSTSYTLVDYSINYTSLFIYALLIVAFLISGIWYFILRR